MAHYTNATYDRETRRLLGVLKRAKRACENPHLGTAEQTERQAHVRHADAAYRQHLAQRTYLLGG